MTGIRTIIIQSALRATRQARLQGATGFFAAARGTATTTTVARPTASTPLRTTCSTTPGSGFRGHRSSVRFVPFTFGPVVLRPFYYYQ